MNLTIIGVNFSASATRRFTLFKNTVMSYKKGLDGIVTTANWIYPLLSAIWNGQNYVSLRYEIRVVMSATISA